MKKEESSGCLVGSESGVASATFCLEDVEKWSGEPLRRESVRAEGFRGIWYELGFHFEYGDKYSGGLGTYTANHRPMAVYCEKSNRTFFTYGATPSADRRELQIAVAAFDHSTGSVERPVVLYFDPAVNDPHDNAAIQLDDAGHVWVFKSGRANNRPGLIFRSVRPYDLGAFDLVDVRKFAYPQVWRGTDGGFLFLFSKYFSYPEYPKGASRELFWATSPDGRIWSEEGNLASFLGHYQASGILGDKVVTFFNWHPEADVDRRTNLYYAQTVDGGKTWTKADGTRLELPLTSPDNAALVIDYQSRGKCMYTCDVNFDRAGNPVLLYVVSDKGEPGPNGGIREWIILHWIGDRWEERVVTTSGHNYDMGSLYIDATEWRIIGPTQDGPQKFGTGGEMAVWVSRDEGRTWELEREITAGSAFNHSYARRPENAQDPFAVFWADGHADELSPSHLFFADHSGKSVYRLPYTMEGMHETPRAVVDFRKE